MRIAHVLLVIASVVQAGACTIYTGPYQRPGAPPPPPPPPAAYRPPQPAAPPPPAHVAAPAPVHNTLPTNPTSPTAPPASVNDQGWVDLGSSIVTPQAQASTIPCTTGPSYKSVRFGVDGSQIEMANIVLVLDAGQRYSPDTRNFVRAGGRSQTIALPGGAHTISQVEFRYQGLTPTVAHATVHVFGHL